MPEEVQCTPVVDTLSLQMGEHLLEQAFEVSSWEDIKGWIVCATSEAVATELESGNCDTVQLIDHVGDSGAGSHGMPSMCGRNKCPSLVFQDGSGNACTCCT